MEEALSSEALDDGGEHVGSRGVIDEVGTRCKFNGLSEKSPDPVLFGEDSSSGISSVASGHGEEMADAHRLEVRATCGWKVLREETDDSGIDGESSFSNGQADGGRGETLTEREELVRKMGSIGMPPALGDDMAMAEEHEAVEVVDLGFDGIYEGVNSRGRDTLDFGGALGKSGRLELGCGHTRNSCRLRQFHLMRSILRTRLHRGYSAWLQRAAGRSPEIHGGRSTFGGLGKRTVRAECVWKEEGMQAPVETLREDPVRGARAGVVETDGYFPVMTAIGQVWIGISQEGISAVSRASTAALFEKEYVARTGRRIAELDEPPGALIHRIMEELAGRRQGLVYDLRGLTPFQQEVLRATLTIPSGEVRSYRWIAEQVGHPRAVRAVGTALARNPIPLLIPCHRVVRSDGIIGAYGLGSELKKQLLEAEGVDLTKLQQLA